MRDHGPGIPPDDLPHVFDRFYRAASARGVPGSGLGLSIVRQVAEGHGGTVRAEIPADGGTLVRLHLRRAAGGPHRGGGPGRGAGRNGAVTVQPCRAAVMREAITALTSSQLRCSP